VTSPSPRYEHKFRIRRSTPDRGLRVIETSPGGFREAHPPRRVSSLYLDTPLFARYTEHTRGDGLRHKYRIRWYETSLPVDAAVFEDKVRHGAVGWKERIPVEPDALVPFDPSRLPDLLRHRLTGHRPVLLVTYLRRYYVSVCGRLRLTLDWDIAARRAESLALPYRGPAAGGTSFVLELKYDREHDDLARRVMESFPFRPTKHSKYVRGVNECYDGGGRV